ncbi:MAG: beta-N-acetylhexosaminidase [Polyangiaceae bacterium]|nr:beta-N-acetylhexosaminidase [Polyangiaceae bacterium]
MPHGLSLEQLCGQLLVCGWDGSDLPSPLLDALRGGERGGIIAFRRNLPDLDAALRAATVALRTAPADLPPFVGIDEEGGRVTRLPAPVPSLPSMRRLGSLDDASLCYRAGRAVGGVLGPLGYNVDFAPVLDVDSNPQNPIIGDRAFSDRPEAVATLALAFARGLFDTSVAACGKHFPGHGDTHLDSHLDLPTVSHGEARLRSVELSPFAAAAAAGLPSLMSAHVVFEALDPGVPATLSHRIATTLLRDELGFRGVLFSDDLEMRALADRLPIEQTAVRAIEAGCDVLLVCHAPELQSRAHAALVERARVSADFRCRCLEAAERGVRLRRAMPPQPDTVAAALQRAGDLRAMGATFSPS